MTAIAELNARNLDGVMIREETLFGGEEAWSEGVEGRKDPAVQGPEQNR